MITRNRGVKTWDQPIGINEFISNFKTIETIQFHSQTKTPKLGNQTRTQVSPQTQTKTKKKIDRGLELLSPTNWFWISIFRLHEYPYFFCALNQQRQIEFPIHVAPSRSPPLFSRVLRLGTHHRDLGFHLFPLSFCNPSLGTSVVQFFFLLSLRVDILIVWLGRGK